VVNADLRCRRAAGDEVSAHATQRDAHGTHDCTSTDRTALDGSTVPGVVSPLTAANASSAGSRRLSTKTSSRKAMLMYA
jgi:hypothetical protein